MSSKTNGPSQGKRVSFHKAGKQWQNTISIDGKQYRYLPDRHNVIDLSDVPRQSPILTSRTRQNCTSKYKGVSYDKATNKWKAQIQIVGKKRFIGYYANEEEAAVDYARAAFKYTPEKQQKFIDLSDVPPQLPILSNSKRVTSSKYEGVCFDKKGDKWMSLITIDGKRHYIGWYEDEEEAAIDYARAVWKYRSVSIWPMPMQRQPMPMQHHPMQHHRC